MPRDIDFAQLTLRDALDLAILIEDEAEERYLEFAEQMDATRTPEAARFFRFMAGNEAKHGQELRERRTARFGNQPALVDRSMLWDVEAPAYEKAAAFMSARQALGVALESETKAYDFFAAALPHISDLDVKALFSELRDEEVEHQTLVRKQLDAQPPDTDKDPTLYADEPPAL